MKKTILFLSVLLVLASGCQKRTLCYYPGSSIDTIRFYERDFPSAAAYNNAVSFTINNGYVCDEKSVSILSK